MAEVKKLVNINLVVIYPNLDIRLIDPQGFQNLRDLEEDPYGSSFVVSPEAMQLILPQRKVSVTIARNRLVVSDSYAKEPKDSDLITKYFQNVFLLTNMFPTQLYGFNYRTEVVGVKGRFLDSALYSLMDGELRSEKAGMAVYKEAVKYDMNFEKASGSTYYFSLNAEREGNLQNIAKPVEELDKFFKEGYVVAKEVINEL